MAAEAAARPIAEPKVRSEWLERLLGQTIALLASLAIALAVGSLLIIAYNESPIAVYGAILRFSVGSLDGFGYVLAIATPLIFSALAVAVCFKGGMFNIGVEGQYFVGMVTGAWAAVSLDFLPGPVHVVVILLAAMLGGTVWAGVPGVLKVKTGAHEVVTTIMMNGIAISLLAWAIRGPLRFTSGPTDRTSTSGPTTSRTAHRSGTSTTCSASLRARIFPGCSSSRSRPRSSSGSSCGGPALGTRPEPSDRPRVPPAPEASPSGRRNCVCS